MAKNPHIASSETPASSGARSCRSRRTRSECVGVGSRCPAEVSPRCTVSWTWTGAALTAGATSCPSRPHRCGLQLPRLPHPSAMETRNTEAGRLHNHIQEGRSGGQGQGATEDAQVNPAAESPISSYRSGSAAPFAPGRALMRYEAVVVPTDVSGSLYPREDHDELRSS
jgi:hypothetical protein